MPVTSDGRPLSRRSTGRSPSPPNGSPVSRRTSSDAPATWCDLAQLGTRCARLGRALLRASPVRSDRLSRIVRIGRSLVGVCVSSDLVGPSGTLRGMCSRVAAGAANPRRGSHRRAYGCPCCRRHDSPMVELLIVPVDALDRTRPNVRSSANPLRGRDHSENAFALVWRSSEPRPQSHRRGCRG